MENIKYDAAVIEKPGSDGLNQSDINKLLAIIGPHAEKHGVYPIEIYNRNGESTAMGFISAESADKIEYGYDNDSEFGIQIGWILADMNLENKDQSYNICGLNVYIGR